MKILLTGSSGFIGSHMYERLIDAGHLVIRIDKKESTDINSIHVYQPIDMIIHLAGDCSTQRGIDNPRLSFEDNLFSTFNICEYARINKTPIIFTSTCKVHPGGDGSRTPYGLFKYLSEEIIREYAMTYGVPFIINRPGTIYGPGQEGSSESGWIAWFVRASLDGLLVTVNGDGTQVRDILYISDYIDLLEKQINDFNTYKNNIYEVGGGKENAVSVNEMLNLLGMSHVTYGNPRKGDIHTVISKNDVPNWKPNVGFLYGLARTKETA